MKKGNIVLKKIQCVRCYSCYRRGCYRNPCLVYEMEGIELKQVVEEKGLGVIMDQELKFHRQTTAAVKKANHILAIIKTIFFNVLNICTLPLLF